MHSSVEGSARNADRRQQPGCGTEGGDVTDYIYKYPIKTADIQDVSMPVNRQILSVHSQYGSLTLWVKVTVEDQGATPMGLVRIGVFGTGHPLPKDITEATFIGTVVTENGQLIWHVWKMT